MTVYFQDFNSTSELAAYLQEVNQNDTLFASYFWWRDFYYVKKPQHYYLDNVYMVDVDSHKEAWCSLCKMLHEDKFYNPKIADLQTILNQNNCKPAKYLDL